MSPTLIEYLTAGPETDAMIEREIFGHDVEEGPRKGIFFVTEIDGQTGAPSPTRAPYPFSANVLDALAILNRFPGWRMWQESGDIRYVNVQLNLVMAPWGNVTITGNGRDLSIALAICKAALMWIAMLGAARDIFNKGQQKETDERVETRQEKTPDAIRDR